MSYITPLIINVLRYFLFAGIPFLIYYILFPNRFSKNKIQERFAKKKDFIREIAYSMQTTVVIIAVALLIIRTPLVEYTQFYRELSDYPIWWLPISIIVGLIIHDTYFYWMHRTVHHPKLYKKVHLVHHQSVNPSPWASYSFHFFEAIAEAMIAPIVLFLMPIHPLALALIGLFSFIINVYGHLGYEIAPKWLRHSIFFEILNTSTHHNMHHSKFKGNYGLYFRFWDKIMGTEHPDYVKEYDKIQERRFGKKEAANPAWKAITPIFIIGIMALSMLSFTSVTTSSIEGKWRNDEMGVVVKIFKKDNLYFGQVLSSDNPEDDKKIKAKGNVVLLKNFKKQNETTYCCGTLYAPKRGITIDATMTVKDANTIRLVGTYGVLTDSSTFKRL